MGKTNGFQISQANMVSTSYLSHCSVAVKRHHHQGKYDKEHGGMQAGAKAVSESYLLILRQRGKKRERLGLAMGS